MIDHFNTLFRETAQWNHWTGDGLKHRESSEAVVKKSVCCRLRE